MTQCHVQTISFAESSLSNNNLYLSFSNTKWHCGGGGGGGEGISTCDSGTYRAMEFFPVCCAVWVQMPFTNIFINELTTCQKIKMIKKFLKVLFGFYVGRKCTKHEQVSYFYIPLSRNMRFPTMWYVRPAKAQTNLHIRVV